MTAENSKDVRMVFNFILLSLLLIFPPDALYLQFYAQPDRSGAGDGGPLEPGQLIFHYAPDFSQLIGALALAVENLPDIGWRDTHLRSEGDLVDPDEKHVVSFVGSGHLCSVFRKRNKIRNILRNVNR